jgi:hypothetical protein
VWHGSPRDRWLFVNAPFSYYDMNACGQGSFATLPGRPPGIGDVRATVSAPGEPLREHGLHDVVRYELTLISVSTPISGVVE